MKYLIQFTALILVFGFLTQCTDPESEAVQIQIQGTVLDVNTLDPIPAAVVRLFSPDSNKLDLTDALGEFTVTLGVDSTVDITLIASKEGYISDTTQALAVPELDIALPFIYLTPVPGGSSDTSGTFIPPSGLTGPASIALSSLGSNSITVFGAGGQDNTELSFTVLDSNGVPAGKDIPVDISMGSSPGGGEYVAPASSLTDRSGRVYANLVSGTRSGVVQVLASVSVSGATIRSQAVPITIHGGLPDSLHFGLGTEKYNFPGYNVWGLTNAITAYAGDKYGNFCAPNTAVYFTTDGGMIDGSGVTSNGQCTVNLVSAPPQPEHPTLGKGFATITARTADENNEEIETDVVVLFSGAPLITDIVPASINVASDSSQTFSFTVSDQNGNPLASDNVVKVSFLGDGVALFGNDVVTSNGLKLPDTRVGGPNLTEFTFDLFDISIGDPSSSNVLLRISVTGPNGQAEAELEGVSY